MQVGALDVHVTFDDALVHSLSCTVTQGGVCNASFSPNSAVFTFANLSGLSGDLGTLTLEAGQSTGTAPLALTVTECADLLGSPIPCTAQSGSASVAQAYPGDVDCSGAVNSVDALKVLRHSSSLSVSLPPGCVYGGDVDCSGTSNSVDGLKILRYSSNLYNQQPAGCPPIGPNPAPPPTPTPVPTATPPPTPTPVPTPTPIPDTLYTNQWLYPGHSLLSPNHVYTLSMQYDGNLVLYSGSTPVWATATNGKAAAGLLMQDDGNLVLYAPGGGVNWQSGTSGYPAANYRLVDQSDGNLVIYSPSNAVIWSRYTGGSPFVIARCFLSMTANALLHVIPVGSQTCYPTAGSPTYSCNYVAGSLYVSCTSNSGAYPAYSCHYYATGTSSDEADCTTAAGNFANYYCYGSAYSSYVPCNSTRSDSPNYNCYVWSSYVRVDCTASNSSAPSFTCLPLGSISTWYCQ